LGSRSDIPYLLNGLDCFVLSSLWEGGPIVIEEAMASCIPVISTTVGMAPEALADDCGILVPPANPEALANDIIQLKENPELRERLVSNAYLRVQSCFSLDVVSEAYTALYQDCLVSSREPFWKQ
jgi:glycosyltransferase involved in cell wall biosynthesis